MSMKNGDYDEVIETHHSPAISPKTFVSPAEFSFEGQLRVFRGSLLLYEYYLYQDRTHTTHAVITQTSCLLAALTKWRHSFAGDREESPGRTWEASS